MITSNPEAYRGHRPSYSAAPGSRASFSAAPGGHRSSFSIAPAGSPTSYSAPPPVFMTEPIPNGLGDRYSIISIYPLSFSKKRAKLWLLFSIYNLA